MYIWSMVDFWFIKIHGLLGLHFILPKSNVSMLDWGEGHEKKKKKRINWLQMINARLRLSKVTHKPTGAYP